MSLRSILGGSGRVKKRAKSSSSSPSLASKSPSTPSASWASSLPRRKPGTTSKATTQSRDEADDYFSDDKLDDLGLVRALATDLSLRDTPQAVQYVRDRMFSQVPDAAGMTSTRIAEVLNYRRALPPLVSVAHIQILLSSPSAVEREIAELSLAGFLRRIVVPRRGAIGEFVVRSAEYTAQIQESTALSDSTREALSHFLELHPGVRILSAGDHGLKPAQCIELVQAGFLTAHHAGGMVEYSITSGTTNQYARPEDRSTLTSLETVSRHAAGSLGTVGGHGAVHNAGGSGGRSGSSSLAAPAAATTEYRLAVPGSGAYLKLVSAALDHLVSLLGKSRFREAPESVLRERWDGGIAKVASGPEHHSSTSAAAAAKRARGEFYGVLPGQTRKWRQFYGLAFDWVLQEAVGAGLVEVFETGSVGRGVRAI